MNDIPNWFRWLIIIIATLIMCACRSPLQNAPTSGPQSVLVRNQASNDPLPGAPLMPPISVAQNVTASQGVTLPPGVPAKAPLLTHTHNPKQGQHLHSHSPARVIELLESNVPVEQLQLAQRPVPRVPLTQAQIPAAQIPAAQVQVPHAPPAQSQATQKRAANAVAALAPVVRRTDSGLRLQEVGERRLAKIASKSSEPPIEKSANEDRSSRAVYMRVGDGDEVVATVAQLDANVGTNLRATNSDNPTLVTSQPLAPVVDPSFIDGNVSGGTIVETPIDASSVVGPSPVTEAPVTEAPVTEAPVIEAPVIEAVPVEGIPVVEASPVVEANPVYGQPILVEDAALPLDQQPHVFNLAPHEEFLPVEEIPVEMAPERWADDPYAQDGGLNIPQGELAKRYPDEYICDGGDANGAVFVKNDWSLRNLDPEDTIGHYDTKAGEVVVQPSNRVCVYAPRFAAARQVTSAFQNEKHEQLLVAAVGLKPAMDEMQQFSNQFDSTLAPQRHVLMQPASSFRLRQAGITGIQRKAVNILAYDVSPHEDFRIMKLGIHKQSEKPRLAEFAAKADTWTNDKAVQVLVDEEIVRTNVSRRGAETFFSIGDNGPAKLRVVKTASKSDALPGEEIEFTLRFDNIGYQTIGNVTIVDNLTTRLEFIDDSDLCSVDCTFLVGDNEAESLMLRWEITDPIEPGHGGLIRFRCRVR